MAGVHPDHQTAFHGNIRGHTPGTYRTVSQILAARSLGPHRRGKRVLLYLSLCSWTFLVAWFCYQIQTGVCLVCPAETW